MKKIIVAVMLALFMCGCTTTLMTDNSTEGYIDISPIAPESYVKDTAVLYFKMPGEALLQPVRCTITADSTLKTEYLLTAALIKSPPDDQTERLINSATAVLSVTSNDEFVYVALSREFLNLPSYADESWQDRPAVKQRVLEERMLAVYSIVSTLTESGQFSRVQITVDADGDGVPEKLTREQMGLTGDGMESQLLGALGRKSEVIASPQTVAELGLKLMCENRIDRLYDQLCSAPDGVALPDEEHFTQLLNSTKTMLTDYELCGSAAISDNGFRAIIPVKFSTKNGNTVNTFEAIPMVLCREGERWRISMDFINRVLK